MANQDAKSNCPDFAARGSALSVAVLPRRHAICGIGFRWGPKINVIGITYRCAPARATRSFPAQDAGATSFRERWPSAGPMTVGPALMKSLCRGHVFRLASLWLLAHPYCGAHRDHQGRVMLFDPRHGQYLGTLEASFDARAPDAGTHVRGDGAERAGASLRMTGGNTPDQSADRSRACVDAVLALIALDLPQWKLRRSCTRMASGIARSSQPQLPIGTR